MSNGNMIGLYVLEVSLKGPTNVPYYYLLIKWTKNEQKMA